MKRAPRPLGLATSSLLALALSSTAALSAVESEDPIKLTLHDWTGQLITTQLMGEVLQKAGWSTSDVDLFEINEAFAMVTMLAMQELGLDHDKVNIHGGACAQGHPIGSTGARIIVSLMHQLQQYGKKRGVAGLCIGGGEATAVAIELIQE